MSGPASEHPHVVHGICTCPRPSYPDRPVLSLNCGLSSHRVQAAATREIDRRNRG